MVCNVIRAEVAASAPEKTGAKAMPQRNTSRGLVLRLVLFTLAGWLLWALGRNSDAPAGREPETVSRAVPEAATSTRTREKRRGGKRRLATALAFTTLFFAGAAFSAGAGDLVVSALEGSTTCTTEADTAEAATEESCDVAGTEEESADDPAAGEEGTSEEASEPAPDESSSDDGQASDADEGGADASTGDDSAGEQPAEGGDQSTDDGSADDGSADEGSSEDGGQAGDGNAGDDQSGDNQGDEPDASSEPDHHPLPDAGSDEAGLTSALDSDPELEFDGGAGYGVVWLHRTLPDPTPPAARLDPGFARALVRTSKAHHVDWALVLGVLRASGHKQSRPASQGTLDRLAGRLFALRANRDAWQAALAYSGRTGFADRAVALERYNRAVGLRALVRGLLAEKTELERRVLADPRLDIYPGGRDDVAQHRINVRVLVLMLYLAECHGQVTVSSLESGHRLYARPGVVSAHVYGLAVDIATLGGVSVLGHQQAGGVTEQAVRNILLLPVELRPKQVISLLGLGGPSFPLADHYDHIHVGY
jgi:hypothetical protein